MKAAGVEFAILGQEESCTGDPARRLGAFAESQEGQVPEVVWHDGIA